MKFARTTWLAILAATALMPTSRAVELPSQMADPIPLWMEGRMPEVITNTLPESLESAGIALAEVHSPRMYRFDAPGEGAKPTVLVCPGGGYVRLCFVPEGLRICEWLNANGYNAYLLLYRVTRPRQPDASFADAKRAIRLLREKGTDWKIAPGRLGMIGFSAGANLVARTSCGEERPDFAMVIYPYWMEAKLNRPDDHPFLAREWFRPDAKTPPTFLVQAQDDCVRVESALTYYIQLKYAGVSTEMHLYPNGGHGYGLSKSRDGRRAVDGWEELALKWMKRTLQAIAPEEKPVLRVGLLSDTHVTPDPASCDRVRQAFGIFRREAVDAVAHLGDLANYHQSEAYRNYRAAMDAVWPDRTVAPRFLYAWGNHDSIDYAKRAQADRQMDRHLAFAAMKDILGIEHDLGWQTTLKGYTFLGFPEIPEDAGPRQECLAKLEAACAASPGKPVFFLHHPPARDTVDFTSRESLRFKRLLAKHPNVVALNGHRHTTALNERSIWQGDYTALEAGCLYQWTGFDSNVTARVYQAFGVMVMDVYGDRIDVRRFDVRDGSEFNPESRWSFPLPFDPKTAPYATARRAAAERPATFPAGAVVRLRCEGQGVARRPVLSIPTVTAPATVSRYEIGIARREGMSWTPFGKATVTADFDELPARRKGFVEAFLQSKVFTEPGAYRFSVSPVGFFGRIGESLGCGESFVK